MSTINTPQQPLNRPHSLDIHSEGSIPLINDLLEAGLSVRIKVSGRSMRPFLMGNEVVTMQKSQPVNLKIGDIVFFVNREGQPLLHRIVRIRKHRDKGVVVLTKGDGNVTLDGAIHGSKVLACVNLIEIQRSKKGRDTKVSIIDSKLFYHRISAVYIARRELIRFFSYWLFNNLLKKKKD